MNYTASSVQLRITKNGGVIQDNTLKHTGGTHAVDSWKMGQFLRKTATGCVQAVVEAGTSAGISHIALSDVTAADMASTDFVPVQEVSRDTRFEMQLFADAATDAEVQDAVIGDQYDIEIVSNVTSLNLSDTTDPMVEITDLSTNYNWYSALATDQYGFVEAKVIPALLDVVPQAVTS